MKEALQDLEAALVELERAHEVAKNEIVTGMMPGMNPYSARNMNGRYILLDSLTAIVNARTTLLMARRESSSDGGV